MTQNPEKTDEKQKKLNLQLYNQLSKKEEISNTTKQNKAIENQ